MKRWLINVWLLGAKELRSVMKDTTLLVLIVFAFTAAVLIVSKGSRPKCRMRPWP
jgi:ABC-2 type transport system permease protein